jgi:hypothetical protein
VPAWKRWSPILLRPEGLYGTRPAEGGNKAAKLRAIREALHKYHAAEKRHRDADPTNNESERALRPSVIFGKVTNGFRSEWGAKTYAALCSIVETGRRNGHSALTAIRDAMALPAAQAAGARVG